MLNVRADYASSGQCQWDAEELMLLERFFETKVDGCLYVMLMLYFLEFISLDVLIIKIFYDSTLAQNC